MDTPTFAIGEWFKQQPPDVREDVLMVLAMLHLALIGDDFTIQTGDAWLSFKLHPDREIKKISESN